MKGEGVKLQQRLIATEEVILGFKNWIFDSGSLQVLPFRNLVLWCEWSIAVADGEL
jgi:hypothetical protein